MVLQIIPLIYMYNKMTIAVYHVFVALKYTMSIDICAFVLDCISK